MKHPGPPGDRYGRLQERAERYRRAGVPLVWFVDPDDETITVHAGAGAGRVLSAGAVADARPVRSAFELDVADFFRRAARRASPRDA